ncbi:MAG: hypothetical protein K6E59_01670 [Bacilli bacterium]|nr:hypothetical protein [Bacilli bacterium]
MTVEGEDYYPQTSFSWSDETVVVQKEKTVAKLISGDFTNLFAIDEKGNQIIIPGRSAPYEGCDLNEEHKKIHYLDRREAAREYTTEELDLGKTKKTVYRVVKSEERELTEEEMREFGSRRLLSSEVIPYSEETGECCIHECVLSKNEIDITDKSAIRKYVDGRVEKLKRDEIVDFVKNAVVNYYCDRVEITIHYAVLPEAIPF